MEFNVHTRRHFGFDMKLVTAGMLLSSPQALPLTGGRQQTNIVGEPLFWKKSGFVI